MSEHRYHSGYQSPARRHCRIQGCRYWGYGAYCKTHTPAIGVGNLACLNCGKPLSKHSMGKLCWQGGEPA